MRKKIIYFLLAMALILSSFPPMVRAIENCFDYNTISSLYPPDLNVAQSENGNSVKLTWSFGTQPPGDSGYYLKVCRSDGTATTTPQMIGTIATNAEYFRDEQVTAGATYQYRLQLCFNNTSCSAYSNVRAATVTQTSTSNPPPPPPSGNPPAMPTNVVASSPQANMVTLSWQDNSNNETAFKIYRRISSASVTWTLISQVASNVTSFNDYNVPAGLYGYMITACGMYGCWNSFEASINVSGTQTAPPPPPTPTPPPPSSTLPKPEVVVQLYTVSGSTSPMVKVSWVPNYPASTGYYYKVWRAQGTATTGIQWMPLGTANTGFGYHIDEAVTPGGYQYQVQLCSSSGCSEYSNSAYIAVPQSGTNPPPPPTTTPPPPPTVMPPPPPTEAQQGKLDVFTVNSNREPLSGVRVEVIPATSSGNISGSAMVKESVQGHTTFYLPAGEYMLRVSLAGFQAPPDRPILIPASTLTTTTIELNKILSSSVTILGSVVMGPGQPVPDAFVWARSEAGQTLQAKSGPDGKFQFVLPTNTKWFFGAGKEIGGYAYNAPDRLVSLENTAGIILELVKKMETMLPPPVTVTAAPTQQVSAGTTDGANVVMPAGAVPDASISMTIKPTVEAAPQTDARVVGTAYDINIQNNTGQAITQTSKDLEITLPFTDSDLAKFNLAAEKLVPSFYDEATGKWVTLTNFTIDKVRRVFVVKVSHLTRFALVAPADTVPPSAPSGLAATQSGTNSITLNWTNPTVDFSHVVVYRGTSSNDSGILLDDYVLGTSYVDANATAGTTWYYRLASVDTAGNQSSDTGAVAVGMSGTSGAHVNGTLILDGKTIYVIRSGKRIGFRDPGEYNSQGFAFAQAVLATTEDKALPMDTNIVTAREGSLVLDTSDNRTVYVIGPNKTKRGFVSMTVLTGLGYNLKNLFKINLSDYASGLPIGSSSEAHPDGALIRDGKTIWWLWQGRKEGFESEAVLKSYGITDAIIVNANNADRQLPEGALVRFRDGTLVLDTGAIYIISDGKKLPFASMTAFSSRGYNLSTVISGSAASYQAGSALQ